MKLIICVDKNMGMMFFGKRQSQDSVLREWIIKHTEKSKLWMSQYSAKQFNDHSGFICDDDYSAKAGDEDFCFVEDKEFNLEDVSEIILCHWNRKYLFRCNKPFFNRHLSNDKWRFFRFLCKL